MQSNRFKSTLRTILFAAALATTTMAQATNGSAGLAVWTKVIWVGQYSDNTSGFYFQADLQDQTCSATATMGHYYVTGANPKGVLVLLTTAATTGQMVSFSINGCTGNRANVTEVWLKAL